MRYCLAYNRESKLIPDHKPGDPAHAHGGKIIEVSEADLGFARHVCPDGSRLSVIELPPSHADAETIDFLTVWFCDGNERHIAMFREKYERTLNV